MKFFICIIFVFQLSTGCINNGTKPEDLSFDTTNTSNVIPISTTNQKALLPFPKDTLFTLAYGSIILPKGWHLANDDTLIKVADATYRYRFHNRNNKLIYLQYGLGTAGNPAEPQVLSYRFRKGYIAHNIDSSDIIFSDNPRLASLRKKSKYLFSSDKIAVFEATFFTPKNSGNGYTGFYIDSIGQIAGNIAELVIYAEGLDRSENEELKKVSRTLTIKNFN